MWPIAQRAEGGDVNTWPDGNRRAMDQSEHEAWNSSNYPGTRQLCHQCGDPTGRCEEDGLWNDDGEPLCEECYVNQIEVDE